MDASVEIPVKVTAWVDEGVAPLVLALNAFEEVVTVGSGQGGLERPAYVRFRRHDGDVAELGATIAGLLAAHSGNIGYELRTIARGRAAAGEPVLELACPTHQVISLALAVRAARGSRSASGADGRASGVRAAAAMAAPSVPTVASRADGCVASAGWHAVGVSPARWPWVDDCAHTLSYSDGYTLRGSEEAQQGRSQAAR